MSHTPGPWKVDKNHKGFVDIRRDVDSYTSDIATVWDFYAKNYRSNARLIAAAPDMLAALEEVMGELDVEGLPCPLCGGSAASGHKYNCLWHVVNAAIQKARGEV